MQEMFPTAHMIKRKEILKDLLPPYIIRKLTGLFYGWHGSYSDWDSALAECTGYDSMSILDKVKQAALIVKNGKARYERDSVLFNDYYYNYPLLTALLYVSARQGNRLNVLDFGGSLGSSYYHCRSILSSVSEPRWNIVEQKLYVDSGIELFQDDILRFYYTVDECLADNLPDILILSSVLPYLREPYKVLESLMQKEFNYIFFDKMPFIEGQDRITVQNVNPEIYTASYPCWFFNENKFLQFINNKYSLIYKFDNQDRTNIKSVFRGYLFELTKALP